MKKYKKKSMATATIFFCSGIILYLSHSKSAAYWLFTGSINIAILDIITIIKECKTKN